MNQSPLEYLCSSPETINPAIVTARHIQHLELSGQVTPEMMEQLAQEAKAAIALRALALANRPRQTSHCRLPLQSPATKIR